MIRPDSWWPLSHSRRPHGLLRRRGQVQQGDPFDGRLDVVGEHPVVGDLSSDPASGLRRSNCSGWTWEIGQGWWSMSVGKMTVKKMLWRQSCVLKYLRSSVLTSWNNLKGFKNLVCTGWTETRTEAEAEKVRNLCRNFSVDPSQKEKFGTKFEPSNFLCQEKFLKPPVIMIYPGLPECL